MAHYFDGQWMDEADMKISVFDITLLRGYGAFEFLRTYNKKPFMLNEHVDRLFTTAEEICLVHPYKRQEIIDIINQGIAKCVHSEVYVKILITGGVSEDGITPGKPSLIFLFLKAGVVPPALYENGVKLVTQQFERYIPVAKSLNYMTAVVTMQKAKKVNGYDVLYVSYDGKILEGTTYNFFAVKNGKVYTSDANILFGITRKFLLDVARENGIEVIAGDLLASSIADFDEAFLTSTTKEVLPVVLIDEQTIGTGKPGPITKKMGELFHNHAVNY